MKLIDLKLFDRFDLLIEGSHIADRAQGWYDQMIRPMIKQGVDHDVAFARFRNVTFWSRAVHHIRVGLKAFRYQHVFGALLQIYRPGYFLGPHKDCGGDNWVLWVLLKPAKKGGDLTLEGPAILDWPRLKLFNGGRVKHAVSKVEQGNRWLLMLQYGRLPL